MTATTRYGSIWFIRTAVFNVFNCADHLFRKKKKKKNAEAH